MLPNRLYKGAIVIHKGMIFLMAEAELMAKDFLGIETNIT